MIVKWKTFRESFPYICNNCGEFSDVAWKYCGKCGKKDVLRKTTREDYEKHIEKVKAETPVRKKPGIHPDRERKIKTAKMILIVFCAFLIIDFIGFMIIMNILNIPLDQIGDHIFVFLILFGFSLFMFIIIAIAIYWSQARGYLP